MSKSPPPLHSKYWGTCPPVPQGLRLWWESTATLRLLGGARGAWASAGEDKEGRGILCRHAHRLIRS